MWRPLRPQGASGLPLFQTLLPQLWPLAQVWQAVRLYAVQSQGLRRLHRPTATLLAQLLLVCCLLSIDARYPDTVVLHTL